VVEHQDRCARCGVAHLQTRSRRGSTRRGVNG
jgi:hypothetical protein